MSSPARRVGVLVVLVTAMLVLIASGVSPQTAVAVLGAIGLLAAEVSTRLLGPLPAESVARRAKDRS